MRTVNGIAVPGEGCPLPWAVIPDHCGTYVADANGEEVFDVSRLEGTAEFQVVAANYHAKMAEIVRRLDDWIVRRLGDWNDNDQLIDDVVKISIDASALWDEYQEAVK